MLSISSLVNEVPQNDKFTYDASSDIINKKMMSDDGRIENLELIYVKKDKKKKDKTYLAAFSTSKPSNVFIVKLVKTGNALSLHKIFMGDGYNMPDAYITISPILNNLFILTNNQTIKFMFRKKKKTQAEDDESFGTLLEPKI